MRVLFTQSGSWVVDWFNGFPVKIMSCIVRSVFFGWMLCFCFASVVEGAGKYVVLQPERFDTGDGVCMLFWLRGEEGLKYRIESAPASSARTPWVKWVPVDLLLRQNGPVLCLDLATYLLNRQQYRAVPVEDEAAYLQGSLPQETEMIWIEPGIFVMGSTNDDPDRDADEHPLTVVRLTKRYALGVHEVTQRQFIPVMGYNPSRFKFDPDHPVTNVRWHDAREYCRRLTALERAAGTLPEGYAYRLPTEAEWEYGCRAGSSTRFHYGDDPDYEYLGAYAWYGGNSGVSTQPVMTRLPNAWGLHGMHGNVHEWCLDRYDYLPGGYVEDPLASPIEVDLHIIRGGSWMEQAKDCRTSDRHRNWFSSYVGNLGFRVALAEVE